MLNFLQSQPKNWQKNPVVTTKQNPFAVVASNPVCLLLHPSAVKRIPPHISDNNSELNCNNQETPMQWPLAMTSYRPKGLADNGGCCVFTEWVFLSRHHSQHLLFSYCTHNNMRRIEWRIYEERWGGKKVIHVDNQTWSCHKNKTQK